MLPELRRFGFGSFSRSPKMGPRTFMNTVSNLMEGVEGKEFLVDNSKDEEEVERVVEEATKEVLRRTGGAGFPLLCNDVRDST